MGENVRSKRSRITSKIFYIVGPLAVVVLLIGFYFVSKPQSDWKEPALATHDYEAVFCCMEASPCFSEEDFKTYRGLQVLMAQAPIKSFSDIEVMLSDVFSQKPQVNTIYLEINPAGLWEGVSGKETKWRQGMKALLQKVKSHPQTTFEFMLSYPQMSYWAALSEESREVAVNAYRFFVDALATQDNVKLYYAGDEQWLLGNADNYRDVFALKPEIEKHLYLSAFCDGLYVVDATEMGRRLEHLKEQIVQWEDYQDAMPDFSDWKIVFIGDSIVSKERDASSIPGVVKVLTGADVYNCGKSGAAAAFDVTAGTVSFLEMLDALLEGDNAEITDLEQLMQIEAFRANAAKNQKLCFVINFGLNDYFTGYAIENKEDMMDVESYAGALRMGVKRLQDAYSQAEIVLMVPTYTFLYNSGTDITSEKGGTLEQYRAMIPVLAEELQVHYKDNYQDFTMDSDNYGQYLSDGTHFHAQGRYDMGEQLVYFLEENVIQ